MKTKILLLWLFISAGAYAQHCGVDVPNYVIDLSSTPDTTWQLLQDDALPRMGQCCPDVKENENCISFDITLHPGAAGVFFDYDGAPALGSLRWRIDCGPEFDLRDTICITDPGPFTLTFCKPGNDNGNYTLISVAEPTFPEDQTVPANCQQPVEILGVKADSPTWTSVSPGAEGDYDHLLACTDCLENVWTPEAGIPSEIEYRVCGYPVLDYCVGNFLFCDTVKFTLLDSLKVFAGDNFQFCAGGSVNVDASASGGDGNYNFIWYNSSLEEIGTGTNINITEAGTYTVEVRDGNYIPGYCDNIKKTFSVSESSPPTVTAGADQVLCGQDPNIYLSGTIENAGGGFWSGGDGTYTPSNTDLQTMYEPTSDEIDNGEVTLRLTSTSPHSGCTNTFDEITVFFTDSIKITLDDMSLLCNSSTTAVNPIVTGGLGTLSYQWSDGKTTLNNNLGEGTYCFTATDENGCSQAKCFTISVPDALEVTMSSTPITSNGGSDGTATAVPNGGVAPYEFLWSNGETSSSISGLDYGIYTVLITDDNGCTIEGSVVVNEPRCNGFYITINSSNVLCNNGTGSATINVVGGTADFDYSWNDPLNQTTQTANDLSAGVYTATVEDANGCFATETTKITEPDALANTMTHSNATTQGGTDGDATANVTGGTSDYEYLWSNGETTASVSNLSEGWYYVDITDENSCMFKDSVYISEPPCNLFNIFVGSSAVTCNGDANGGATLVTQNGTGPFNIVWSSGETDVTSVSGLEAGLYTVEVTDSKNCFAFQSFGVSEPSPFSVGLKATPSTCYGFDNGTIDATVSGGNFPGYYFSWDNGESTEDMVNLAPATYMLTVTDEEGCETSASATLTEPTQLEVAYTSVDASCNGYSDGSIDITPSGGTTPYSFDWSNGESTEDLSNIDFGTYILDIKDANFCEPLNDISVSINHPAIVEADDIVISCPNPGESSTLVNITPIGGTADYSVSSDGGNNFGSVSDYELDLSVNSDFTIVIKDSRNCLSEEYQISIDDNVVINDIDFNTCYYGNQTEEEVSISVSGGTADYSISTDLGLSFNSPGDYDIDLSIADSYSIIAKDSKGCISETHVIELPEILNLELSITSDFNGEDISCFGFSDGSASSSMSGGTAPYSFDWSNGSDTPNISGLSAGNYILTVTDENGCSIDESVTLENPDDIYASISVTSDYNGQDISCFGASDGSAKVFPSGGVSPFTFLWNDGSSNQENVGLSAGNYSVDYIDNNGCTKNISIEITEPDALSLSAEIKAVTCNGGSDGEIDLTAAGGTMPYQFLWDHSAMDEDLTNLTAGTFAVTLTDANGCFKALGGLVVDPTNIKLSVEVSDALCFGDENGMIDLSVEGGIAPYDYEWSNGAISEDIDGLSTGDYTVVVTDQNDCFIEISGFIDQPRILVVDNTISHISCFDLSDGAIDIEASGGTTPYSFLWENGSTNEDQSNLAAGTYTLTVVDNNGCSNTESYTVTQPDGLLATLESPSNFHDNNINFNGGSNGSIISTPIGGTTPYYYEWSNGETTKDISGLSAGIYSLLLTDENGCTYEVSLNITEPLMLELPTGFSPNNDKDNETYVIRGIEAYPNNKLIVLNRWGNIIYTESNYHNTWTGINQNGNPLPDGVYFVILEIDNKEIVRNDFVELKRK